MQTSVYVYEVLRHRRRHYGDVTCQSKSRNWTKHIKRIAYWSATIRVSLSFASFLQCGYTLKEIVHRGRVKQIFWVVSVDYEVDIMRLCDIMVKNLSPADVATKKILIVIIAPV